MADRLVPLKTSKNEAKGVEIFFRNCYWKNIFDKLQESPEIPLDPPFSKGEKSMINVNWLMVIDNWYFALLPLKKGGCEGFFRGRGSYPFPGLGKSTKKKLPPPRGGKV